MASIQHLEIAGEQVGRLEWGPNSDFPWAKGKWIPLETFQKYEQYLSPTNNNYRSLDFSQLLDAGISSTQLRLIPDKDNNDIEYLHGLVLGDDDYAAWRFGEEAFGDD